MGPETSEVYVNGTFLWVYIFFDKLLYSKLLIHFTLIFFYKIFDFREGNVHSDLCLLHR